MVTITLYDGTGYLDLTFFNQPWTATPVQGGHGARGVRAGPRCTGASSSSPTRRSRSSGARTRRRCTPAGSRRCTRRPRASPRARSASWSTGRSSGCRRSPTRCRPSSSAPRGSPAYDEAHPAHPLPRGRPEALGRPDERLKFDELFTLELGVALPQAPGGAPGDGRRARRRRRRWRGVRSSALPFEPTGAQRRAMAEIDAAMARPRPMNRLLQGDVGSGKTVVALHAALVADRSRATRPTIMAPTEVLAGQHLRTVAGAARAARRACRTSTSPRRRGRPPPAQASLLDPGGRAAPPDGTARRSRCSPALGHRQGPAAGAGGRRDGAVDLVVGTHALVQEGVDVRRPVARGDRRAAPVRRPPADAAEGQGRRSPDVLIMTATPIPRTLALTYYGDLDVSSSTSSPRAAARRDARRPRRPPSARAAYDAGPPRRSRPAGRPSSCARRSTRATALEVKAAEAEAERLATEVFPDLARRAAARPHAPGGQGGAHGGVPGGRAPTS